MLLLQNTATASVCQRFLSSPKLHYMYNVLLIPNVVCFLAELIIVLSSWMRVLWAWMFGCKDWVLLMVATQIHLMKVVIIICLHLTFNTWNVSKNYNSLHVFSFEGVYATYRIDILLEHSQYTKISRALIAVYIAHFGHWKLGKWKIWRLLLIIFIFSLYYLWHFAYFESLRLCRNLLLGMLIIEKLI